MSRRYPAMLAAVALLWGASFLFIKVAVGELAPSTLIMGRLGLGALALAVIVPVVVGGRATVHEIRRNLRWLVVVALVNVAIPFWLLSWGETRIDSGLASIIQASVPPPVVALGTTGIAALAALPVGLVQAPHDAPSWKPIASVVVLAIPLTAFAFLLFYAIIAGAGAAFASLVTYLVPPIALAYGAIFLDERFGAAALGGLALILAGVVLGTGRVRLRRRASV